MKVVALVSGGKDSCYAMMRCIHYGHQVVALANLLPADDSVDELDSYMYQTVGHQIIVSYAECMGVPLFRKRIKGSTRHQDLSYVTTPGDEVEDMFILLNEVKRQIPSITAVSSGAIASDYQRLRVESVCSRLGLVSLAYLWKQDQSLLLREMITNEIMAITVKVAAMGLNPDKHLGKEIAFLEPYLHKLKDLYGINVCGEGGEYETLTLDCPLFINARIVLDESQVILHSSDSIAPVGVLHPLAYHLENKADLVSLSDSENPNNFCKEKTDFVFEVQEDYVQPFELTCHSNAEVTDLVETTEHKLQISRTRKDNAFSICCWLQDSSKTSSGLQEDLVAVLKKIESQFTTFGVGWENVLYIHLYIDDMNAFTMANETYVRFITQEKCTFGVPSRSTIELPLLQAGLGGAYMEVLVANNHSKRVLHVQSISCWAPSCIGPYSQATLHEEVLLMAGQLGLDPPTMALCTGGPTVELEQALENSEAVANCFKCSISTSAILIVIYCSTNIPSSGRLKIQEKQDAVLKKMRLCHTDKAMRLLDPILLYVLVPDLPKSALVEVKPVLYVPEDIQTDTEDVNELSSAVMPDYWGFQNADWHQSCIQECVVDQKICAAVVCITSDHTAKICCNSAAADENHQTSITEEQLRRVSRFCIYLLEKFLMENSFAWDDITNLRFYLPTSLGVSWEKLNAIFTKAFEEIGEMSERVKTGEEPLFNIVPILGAGSSITSMDNIISCELFARKF